MAAGDDADAAIFDSGFLQVDQGGEEYGIVDLLAGVPGHHAGVGRAYHQVVVLVGQEVDIGAEKMLECVEDRRVGGGLQIGGFI